VTLDDFEKFKTFGIVASVQPRHATSDMLYAEDRLGSKRLKGAYAWRTFKNAGVHLALGSDFPIEPADPILGFYSAVTRQSLDGEPQGGWYPSEKLTRSEALSGFTLDAAYAGFQDHWVGSIKAGKLADFVVLDRDIMTIPDNEIPATKVLATYLSGKAVFDAASSERDNILKQ
jgi:predicted amidohydrolase YtcJ